MDFGMRHAYVDFDRDATIDASALADFQYVSKGGFALVFVANYRQNSGATQPVAVKVLKPENHFKPANFYKFLQEVAVQTALAHQCIVRSLGFCSIPVSKLIGAAPASILVPGCNGTGGGGGRKARSPQEWFAQRRLTKCWALVLELMPDGNMFDQVRAATEDTTAVPGGGRWAPPSPALGTPSAEKGRSGVGCYTDVEALQWLIEVADAMTLLHSRQPLLIHRDLKLENILLRREADGRLHAKLSDFGLTVAVDASGRKVPAPQVLRAPGQTLQDVVDSASAGGDGPRGTRGGAPQPRDKLRERDPVGRPAWFSSSQMPGRGARKQQPHLLRGAPQVRTQTVSQVPDRSGQQDSPGCIRPTRVSPSGAGSPVVLSAGPGTQRLEEGPGMPHVCSCPQMPQHPPAAGVAQAPGRGQGQDAAPGCPAVLEVRQGPLAAKQVTAGPRGGGGGAAAAAAAAAVAREELLPEDLRPQRSVRSWSELDIGVEGPCLELGDLGPLAPEGAAAWVRPHRGTSQVQRPRRYAAGERKGDPAGDLACIAAGLLAAGSATRCQASRQERMSATGHRQVRMSQLSELVRQGRGHRDYLPDMYHLNFKLTTQCGSVCYMAPEVARQLPYNQKADVFSFGCILFEVTTRQLLSDGMVDGDVDAAMEYLSRVSWGGWRPELPAWLPKDLRLLISLSWHREPRLRPSFPTIATRLREALYTASLPSVPSLPSLSSPTCVPPGQQPPDTLRQQQQKLEQQYQQLSAALQQQQAAQQLQQQQQQWVVQMKQQLQRQNEQFQRLQQQQHQHQQHMWLQGVQQQQQQQRAASPLGGPVLVAGSHFSGEQPALHPNSQLQHRSSHQLQHHHQQQQLQLQLQLQQLNACTIRGATATGACIISSTASSTPATAIGCSGAATACTRPGNCATSTGLLQRPLSPCPGSSPFIMTCPMDTAPTSISTTSGVQQVLSAVGVMANGVPSVTFTVPSRVSSPALLPRSCATTPAGTINGELTERCETVSLPSPARRMSTAGVEAGQSGGGGGGAARRSSVNAGRMSRSEGSVAGGASVSGPSARSVTRTSQMQVQHQQQSGEGKRLQANPQEGCMSLCVVM